MARWGNCDYRQLQKLRENLDRLQSADLENFCRDVSKELAARLLALVIPPIMPWRQTAGSVRESSWQ